MTTTTTGTLARPDGVTLAYEDSGGTGPLIVLTHGFTLTLRMWDPTVEALAGAGYRVVTWDARGHGATVTPEDPALYDLDAVVADLVALLDHLGADRAVLGGLSFGGYLALATWCAAPERIRALILADTGPGYRNPDAREGWNRQAVSRAAEIESGGMAALVDNPSSGSTEAVKAQVGFDRHRSVEAVARAVRGFLTQHDGRVMEQLGAITVPALVLVGADDAPFRQASEVMAAKIPGAELVVIPDAGHVANLDQPAAFSAAVVDFLDRQVKDA